MKSIIRLIIAVAGVISLGLAIIWNAERDSVNDYDHLQRLGVTRSASDDSIE